MDTEGSFEFTIATPIGLEIRWAQTDWNSIVEHKHPVLRGHEEEVKTALADPEEIRRSRKDLNVLLFYRGGGSRWIHSGTRAESGDGFHAAREDETEDD